MSLPQVKPPRVAVSSLYLNTVFTFKPFPTVVRHLVTNQVGFPVESLGTLVTLVLPLLGVDHHVLLQAGKETQADLWTTKNRH